MIENIDNVIENIDFTMKMEDMPLTDEDKFRLKNCIDKNLDIDKILQELIKKHSVVADDL